MDDFSVAKWYMDNGSLSHSNKQKDRAFFSTHAFEKSDVERLANKLFEMYGVSCSVEYSKGWTLRVNSGKNNEIDNMWAKISPYIVPCMKYKMPNKYRNDVFIEHNIAKKIDEFKNIKIVNIKKIKVNKNTNFKSGVGYDISTTTANYIADNILVHNSLGILHYDHLINEWNVATRSVPDADVKNGFNKTFRQIFEICLKDISFDDFTSKCEKHITYMFEILSPWNQVVVLHEEPKLILLGARNNITLEEYDINCIDLPVEKPNTYKFSTWQELSDYLESRPASIAEGFVVMTKDFKRVKIKSLNYVNAHRISSNVGSSERNMLEAILNNCEDDLEPIIPKYIFEELMVMKSKYIVIMNSILLAYEDVIKSTDSSNKKEVALYINSKYEKQKHFLFSIIKNGSYDAFIKSAKKDGGFTKSFLDSFLEQF